MCTLTPAEIISNQKAGFANAAWSIVKYEDVFGRSHRSEQCVEIDFLGDPSIPSPNVQRLVDVCPIPGCEDEECKAN